MISEASSCVSGCSGNWIFLLCYLFCFTLHSFLSLFYLNYNVNPNPCIRVNSFKLFYFLYSTLILLIHVMKLIMKTGQKMF